MDLTQDGDLTQDEPLTSKTSPTSLARGLARQSSQSGPANRTTLFDVPENKEVELVGRKKDLEDVLAILKRSGVVAIGGMAGIGKTSLALKLVHEIKNQYDVVWYITCSNENNFQQSICKISQIRPWLDPLESATGRPGEYHFIESFECARSWVYSFRRKKERILLVFDGLNKSNESSTKKYTVYRFLEDALPPEVHCIFTTQATLKKVGCLDVDLHYHKLFPLSEKSVETALIDRHVSNINDEDGEAARNIAKAIGGIPLLLDLVSAFVNENSVTLHDYYKWSQPKKDLLLLEKGKFERQWVYGECIRRAISGKEEKELLIVLAHSDAPNPVPIHLFTLGIDGLDDSSALGRRLKPAVSQARCSSRGNPESYDFVPMELHVLLRNLKKCHLIDFDNADPATERNSRIVMHAEIARQVKNFYSSLKSNEKQMLSKLLQAAFKKFRTNMMPVYEALLPHAAKLIGPNPKQNRFLDPHFLMHVGRMNSILGHFIDGKKILLAALERAREDGELLSSAFHASTLQYLGEVERRRGDLNEAKKLISKSVRLWELRVEYSDGEEKQKENLALAQIAYAEVFLDAGDCQKTLKYLEDSEALERFELRANDSTASYVHDKGSIYGAVGRAHHSLREYGKAIACFDKGVRALEEHEYRYELLQAHVRVSTARSSLGNDKKEFDRNFDSCLEALRKVENRYGSQHRFTAWMKREMAKLYLDKASFKSQTDAEKMHFLRCAIQEARASLGVQKTLLTANHQKIAKVCNVIADICLKLADIDEASIGQARACAKIALKRAIEITECLQSEFTVSQFLNSLKAKENDLLSVDLSKVSFEAETARESQSWATLGNDQLKSDSKEVSLLKKLKEELETVNK